MAKQKRMVVVTTDKDRRGVFFGELKSHNKDSCDVTLVGAQMCVYWSRQTKGVLGLASHGPQDGCRITPQIPTLYLNGVTAVMDATDAATKEWRTEKWN